MFVREVQALALAFLRRCWVFWGQQYRVRGKDLCLGALDDVRCSDLSEFRVMCAIKG